MALKAEEMARLEAALCALGRGERTATGQPAGLAEVYDLMARAIYSTAYVITEHREDAEDVLQDTLIKVCRDAGRYRPGTRPQAWILTVAHHTALDLVRRRRRRATVPLEDIEALAVAPAEGEEELASLLDLLAQLNDEERRLMVLRIYHELPYEEIAEVMGISVAAAQKRYQRALSRLRVQYGAEPGTRYTHT